MTLDNKRNLSPRRRAVTLTHYLLFAMLYVVLSASASHCKGNDDVVVSTPYSLPDPQCAGYVAKHTLDESYLAVTVILPQDPDPSKPKSFLMTFKKHGEEAEGTPAAYNLDHVSQKRVTDAEPIGDTFVTLENDKLCLHPELLIAPDFGEYTADAGPRQDSVAQ